MLKKAYKNNELEFHGRIADWKDAQCFDDFVNSLYLKEWVVNSKETFNGPETVLEYLGRYTHRVCISNNRILKIENGKVTFEWKDNRDGGRKKGNDYNGGGIHP